MPSDDENKNGGPNHLRAWMEHRGIKGVELANKLGGSVTPGMVSDLANGKRALSAKWLRRLADALETTPGALLDHGPNNAGEKDQNIGSDETDLEESEQATSMSSDLSKGKRLKMAREASGYSSASEAALAMGVVGSTYISHENGMRGFPAPRARQYAQFFQTTPEWLLFGRAEGEITSGPIAIYDAEKFAEALEYALRLLLSANDPTNSSAIRVAAQATVDRFRPQSLNLTKK
jgi:transcriptional regulator with XRE-family HTH domain